MSNAQRQLFAPPYAFLGSVEVRYGHSLERPLLGVDEAGRGPLAGPVVAAAVSLPPELRLPHLDDSKKLSEAQREALFDPIREQALAHGIGIASHDEIDALNILQATFLAMRRAIELALTGGFVPALVVVDGKLCCAGLELPQRPVIKGDALSRNIAAASVLAKVTRDRIMIELHERYPAYDFARHKGYPTPAHRERIAALGPSPVHRTSFRGVREFVR
ncbi:MAG: ribonuclease HII [Myxococcales bacterium]|nr:ribonuclease HII [Myxococcales bacterium]